ncbi:ZCPW2-like protein, partial [Mya arenaria]
LTENIWVQCDNPDCQKWRRIPARFADSLDDQSWYCHMNPDRNMNTCSATEEDHAKYDRMARKAGIKWPAVITRDPEVGVHVLIDIDGDPTTYHIEFLGNPHSHSWVAAKHVQVYGHKNLEDIDGSQSQSQPHTQRPGRGRLTNPVTTTHLKARQRKGKLKILTAPNPSHNHTLKGQAEE